MPIRNYVTGDVPYLTSYEPFTLPNGITQVDFISQMISYNLQPLKTPTEITYFIGAENSYVTTLEIKNLTDNVTLTGTITFNKDVFVIYDEFNRYIDGIDRVEFSLEPEKIESFKIEVNKKILNSVILNTPLNTLINITIKNVTTNGLTLKKINQSSLAESTFPQNITVK
jgi:hypothetical protein